MKPTKIYLDSGILIASYHKKDIDPTTKINRHEIIKKLFNNYLINTKIHKLIYSQWTISESVNVLIKNKNYGEAEINRWVMDVLFSKSKIFKSKLNQVALCKDYPIDELFIDIRRALVGSKEKIHIGDIIHYIIMKKHKLNTILTFDDTHYKKFSNITVLNPIKILEILEKEENKPK